MGFVAKITLDADTFRALASSTRLTVLKALSERRKTLTELSRDLNLNKATVHEHMALLTAAGLVRKRDDEGRKWIYYELTWTGQRILHPEATTTFNLLLGLSVAAAGGGVAMLGRALGWWLQDKADDGAGARTMGMPPEGSQPADAPPAEDAQQFALTEPVDDAANPSFFDDGGWLSIALFVTMALFVVLAGFLHRRLQPKPGDDAAAEQAESRLA
jgi:DNA-binding transcriptional ArsR family regulator